MNKKLIYAAMALPMLFTACSQDELFEEANGGMDTPKVKGYKVDLVTDRFDGNGITRATWDTNKLTWDPDDKISVYWLGLENNNQTTTALDGWFNSVYNTDDGEKFTSQSLIYQGGNVAVFPANLAHTTKKGIEISIPTTQGADVENETPYISNRLNVTSIGNQNNQDGYNKELFAPLKQAANVVTFEFTLANTEELLANKAFNFQVNSVSLVADANAFAEKAAIIAGVRVDDGTEYTLPKTDGYEKWNVNRWTTKENYAVDRVLEVSATASSKSLTSTSVETVDAAKSLYKATFVVLPTDATSLAAASEIVIETTCGRINLKTTETTGSGDKAVTTAVAELTKVDAEDENAVAPVVAGAITNKMVDEDPMTIKQMIEKITSYRRNTANLFEGEKVGRTYILTFEADMANATLNDSKVYNSDDILRYVGIYTAMNSQEKMNLVLCKSDIYSEFKYLTAEAVEAVHSCNTYGSEEKDTDVKVTLSLNKENGKQVYTVDLQGGGDFSAIINERNSGSYGSMWASGTQFNVLLKNAGETAWVMNDCWKHPNVILVDNSYGKLIVNGTDGDDEHEDCVLSTKIKNYGTLEIGGTGVLKVADRLTQNKILNVAADQDLRFNANTSINGTINVAADAFLTVEEGVELTTTGTINNSGVVSSIAGNGGIVNNGTINVVTDDAVTYVQENNGTINLKNRDDEVKVQGNKGDIVYNYTAKDGENFVRSVADKFTDVVFGDETPVLVLAENNISDIDITINGTTNLYANGQEIRDLAVNGHLKLLTPEVDYNKVLYVRSLTNDGNITIGGTIYYTNSYANNTKNVRSVGNGAIVQADKVVSDLAGLQAALANGNNVVITKAIEITENTTIDLNGCTIANTTTDNNGESCGTTGKACAVFYLNNADATLTITGEGSVEAVTEESLYNIPVWVRNGNVIIEGGDYLSGIDKEGNSSHCVYGMNAANITIKGGSFKCEGNGNNMVLNCQDASAAVITVEKGFFYGFSQKNAIDVTGSSRKTAGNYEVVLAEGSTWSESVDDDGYYSVTK